mmetsp:Transcript_22976/g.38460  ORF Transcript_22976/g.38460 Transcript_22976/m.38460 type:complete len:368 (+) Transcript_22976:420-1523(+)|eukprot:CAMPEP_0198210478 /NCGR_PEP_ID=MMETSP1445-20131203/20127_1 /TAXON_ID=36898 /ORGANISM="Pyramimonas sp., Strain CCMP2087" /LENGTH=367 /DNA_ID=CAMNT_0043884545 /DNA_START=380 /DNA_END=1483 /DNA_ORIENTATION=-
MSVPESVTGAVLVASDTLPEGTPVIRGYDFNKGVNHDELLNSLLVSGFQATNFGKAVQEVQRMIDWRLSDDPVNPAINAEDGLTPEERAKVRCKIFLGYTSNLISAGTREVIRYVFQHSMIDCAVTTAGGIEEDLIKCMANTFVGDFTLAGKVLRQRGLNRIGNMLVPNDNYCKFEDWIMPILDQMLKEQQEVGTVWTPSKMIWRFGKEINHPDSVCYWAYKNQIPIYSPAITDGSIGDMLYFHTFKNPGLVVDVVQDIRAINDEAVHASPSKTGMLILGGGVCKHHICNANLMRNGADYSVYVNTAQEFDGSDAGARPDEAISWGKIKFDADPVKVHGDATILFPLLVAQTFAKRFEPKAKNPPSM